MLSELTPQQARIAELVKVGKVNKIIAYEMGISEATIKSHLRNVMVKFRLNNRCELAYMLMMKDVEEWKRRALEAESALQIARMSVVDAH